MPLFGLAVELRFIISLARALRTGSMKWDNLNGSSYELIIDKVKKLIEGFINSDLFIWLF